MVKPPKPILLKDPKQQKITKGLDGKDNQAQANTILSNMEDLKHIL